MEEEEPIVFVIGPRNAGKDTLVELLTGNKAPPKLQLNVSTYKFDFVTWHTTCRKTRGIYTSCIDNLELVKAIAKVRKPPRAYVLVVLALSQDRLNFNEVNKISSRAIDFCTFIGNLSNGSAPQLLFAVSKFDYFCESSPEVQDFNKRFLASLTFYHKASLIAFCRPSTDADVAAAAKAGFLRFLGDERGGLSQLSLNFEWRAGEDNYAYKAEHTKTEVTIDAMKVNFGGEEPIAAEQSDEEEMDDVEEEPCPFPELNALIVEQEAQLSINFSDSEDFN